MVISCIDALMQVQVVPPMLQVHTSWTLCHSTNCSLGAPHKHERRAQDDRGRIMWLPWHCFVAWQ
jgi:hypothetical protein